MRPLLLIIALVVAGCDKVVKETVTSKWQAPSTQSCTYTGFCTTCGMDYHGDYSCGFRFTNACSGRQAVMSQFTEVERLHESDARSRYVYEDVLQVTGTCH